MTSASPTIQFCCISFQEVILVTHQTEPENYTSIICGILPNVPHIPGSGPRKLTFHIGRFQVHLLTDNDNGITYSCISQITDIDLLPFTFLDAVKTKFCEAVNLVQRAPNAEENEFERVFAPVLAAAVYSFNANQGSTLSRLETQVHVVKEIILSNVENIERSEQLEELINKSENLVSLNSEHHETRDALRRQQKCETWKMWLLISALLGALLTTAMLIASGVIIL